MLFVLGVVGSRYCGLCLGYVVCVCVRVKRVCVDVDCECLGCCSRMCLCSLCLVS